MQVFILHLWRTLGFESPLISCRASPASPRANSSQRTFHLVHAASTSAAEVSVWAHRSCQAHLPQLSSPPPLRLAWELTRPSHSSATQPPAPARVPQAGAAGLINAGFVPRPAARELQTAAAGPALVCRRLGKNLSGARCRVSGHGGGRRPCPLTRWETGPPGPPGEALLPAPVLEPTPGETTLARVRLVFTAKGVKRPAAAAGHPWLWTPCRRWGGSEGTSGSGRREPRPGGQRGPRTGTFTVITVTAADPGVSRAEYRSNTRSRELSCPALSQVF